MRLSSSSEPILFIGSISYYFLLGLTYLLYILILLQGWNKAPAYLTQVNIALQAVVSILLLWFFHPFVKYKYHPLHKSIAFTAGLFLFTSTVLTRIIVYIQTHLGTELNQVETRLPFPFNHLVHFLQLISSGNT